MTCQFPTQTWTYHVSSRSNSSPDLSAACLSPRSKSTPDFTLYLSFRSDSTHTSHCICHSDLIPPILHTVSVIQIWFHPYFTLYLSFRSDSTPDFTLYLSRRSDSTPDFTLYLSFRSDSTHLHTVSVIHIWFHPRLEHSMCHPDLSPSQTWTWPVCPADLPERASLPAAAQPQTVPHTCGGCAARPAPAAGHPDPGCLRAGVVTPGTHLPGCQVPAGPWRQRGGWGGRHRLVLHPQQHPLQDRQETHCKWPPQWPWLLVTVMVVCVSGECTWFVVHVYRMRAPVFVELQVLYVSLCVCVCVHRCVSDLLVYAIGIDIYTFEAQTTHLGLHCTS